MSYSFYKLFDGVKKVTGSFRFSVSVSPTNHIKLFANRLNFEIDSHVSNSYVNKLIPINRLRLQCSMQKLINEVPSVDLSLFIPFLSRRF